jgi:hypothetical protein
LSFGIGKRFLSCCTLRVSRKESVTFLKEYQEIFYPIAEKALPKAGLKRNT